MVSHARRRTVKGLILVVLLFSVSWSFSSVSASPSAQQSCQVYNETGGFSVCDDSEARFRTALSRWGVQRIGYPISDRYTQDGFVTQAFQKGIMQWRADSQSVALVNVFDDLHKAGLDETLLDKYQTPSPLPDNYDQGLTFTEAVTHRQELLEARPALRGAYFAVGDPLTFFGLPTSEVEDMGNHFAIRLQRAVLQEWKEDVPWAKAGEVTVANGGEIARALGVLPGVDTTTDTTEVTPVDPYEWLTVASLRARTYGTEGSIERVRVMEQNSDFTRYEIRYPSDGLMIGGFMNVPTGQGPFPTILVNHGYMPPDTYEIMTYTTKYADALARAGFLVLHTNYRNHRGSDTGPDTFKVGMAIDVLNLLELTKKLPEADVNNIGMWGHSMGGGITLRALTVTNDVKAALVYGAMSSDEVETVARAQARGFQPDPDRIRRRYPILPQDDPDFYFRISPIHYMQYVTADISIHHGEQDTSVPFEWSGRLRDELTKVGKNVEYFAYPGQPHNFVGSGYDLLMTRTIEFFNRELK